MRLLLPPRRFTPPLGTPHPPPLTGRRWKALDEINAGSCDGLTYAGVKEMFPDEYAARGADKLRYRCGW